jgi:hypothetical protein
MSIASSSLLEFGTVALRTLVPILVLRATSNRALEVRDVKKVKVAETPRPGTDSSAKPFSFHNPALSDCQKLTVVVISLGGIVLGG